MLSRGSGDCGHSMGGQAVSRHPAPQTAKPAEKVLLPREPRFESVYEAHVPSASVCRRGHQGSERGLTQLLGGVFEGPKIRGKVLPSTRDWPVYLQNGVRTTDVDYVFVTDDGVHLFITVRGFRYDVSKMKGAALEAEAVDPAPTRFASPSHSRRRMKVAMPG